ncbi:hypothetical protein, partial [Geminocystis sp. GBBB08]|uniref:hypothetical protein n=1 Tax=Geminocystis sp. GBBB08 TaxID=2604140 RepID=UPI0027E39892
MVTINDSNTTPFQYLFDEDNNFSFTTISLTDDPFATLEVTLTVTNGTLTLGSLTGLTFTTGDGTEDTIITFYGSLANVNNALNSLLFNPNHDYNGNETLAVSVTSTVDDGINPPIITNASQNVSLTINPVNDAPVLTPSGILTSIADEDTLPVGAVGS